MSSTTRGLGATQTAAGHPSVNIDSMNIMPSALPPEVASFIKGVTPALYHLTLSGICLGIMIPLFIVLFVASDAPLRRKPIFIFNVISVIIGIGMGLISVIIHMKSFIDPIHGVNLKLVMASGVMFIAMEFFVDGILLFRVYSVFPRRTTRKAIWFGIFIPILILKIARLTNIILFIVGAAKAVDKIPFQEVAIFVYTLPELKIGWGLQLVDNTACSVIFIWKLKKGQFRVSTSSSLTVVIDSYATRLKALFWIATSNFVFPALFDIVLLVTATSVDIKKKGTLVLVVHQSDIYIEIIGVLFATIWVANTRANFNRSSAGFPTSVNSMQFVPNPALATNRSHNSSKKVAMVPVTVERTENIPTDEMSAFQRPKSSESVY